MNDEDQKLIDAGTHARVVVRDGVEIAMPVVYRTARKQFVVVSNLDGAINLSFDPARRNPYFVVHAASGIRAPRPWTVDRQTRGTTGKIARALEASLAFDPVTGELIISEEEFAVVLAEIEGMFRRTRP